MFGPVVMLAVLPDQSFGVGGGRGRPVVGDEQDENDQADGDHEKALQRVVAGLKRFLQLGHVSHLKGRSYDELNNN